MLARCVLAPILNDEGLTRGLADPEARVLVEWLVEQAEALAASQASAAVLEERVQQLCRRARGIGRFVVLWCHRRQRGAACQLAAAEQFTWPLPTSAVDPCELMQGILVREAAMR